MNSKGKEGRTSSCSFGFFQLSFNAQSHTHTSCVTSLVCMCSWVRVMMQCDTITQTHEQTDRETGSGMHGRRMDTRRRKKVPEMWNLRKIKMWRWCKWLTSSINCCLFWQIRGWWERKNHAQSFESSKQEIVFLFKWSQNWGEKKLVVSFQHKSQREKIFLHQKN